MASEFWRGISPCAPPMAGVSDPFHMNTLAQEPLMTDEEVASANRDLALLSPEDRVRWVLDRFPGRAILSTSFGIQAAVMLHLVTRIDPQIPVVFVDTGYLFPETYRFAEQLSERLALNLKTYAPLVTAARQEALYGKLWEQGVAGLEKYGRINKVEPMNRALRELGAQAWLTGLRRDHSSTREHLEVLKLQKRTLKVHPIVEWTDRDIYQYLQRFDLPYHPLWDEGYISVGDVHSTVRFADGMKPEDTRFAGLKRECGLHEQSGEPEYQI